VAGSTGRQPLYIAAVARRSGDEQQDLARVPRCNHAFRTPGLVRVVRVFDEIRDLRPEDRLGVGVPGVERVCEMGLVMGPALIACGLRPSAWCTISEKAITVSILRPAA
jgi:hypothetical protein